MRNTRKTTAPLLAGLLCLMLCANALPALAGDVQAQAMDILGVGNGESIAEVKATMPPGSGAGGGALATNSFRFSVSPVLPDNQVDVAAGYFYLRTTPGAQQTLTVMVKNEGEDPITVTASLVPATTNANGVMQYQALAQEDLNVYPVDITTLATLESEEITLAGLEEKAVTITVNVPEDAFDGTLLGGIVFQRQPDADEAAQGGVSINSIYSYVVPLRLVQSDETPDPSFSLADVSANEETPFGYQTSVQIHNEQPVIVKPLSMEYALIPADGGEAVVSHSATSIEMAPSTVMPYAVRQEEVIAPGEYTAQVTLTYQDATYTLEKPVTVTK